MVIAAAITFVSETHGDGLYRTQAAAIRDYIAQWKKYENEQLRYGSPYRYFFQLSYLALKRPKVLSMTEVQDALRQVWPEEISENQVPGLLSTCRLKTYQKQSLAFMLEVERSPPNGKLDAVVSAGKSYDYYGQDGSSSINWYNRFRVTRKVKSGLLCDSVGLGKTLVCIALVMANRAQDIKPISHSTWESEVVNFRKKLSRVRRTTKKMTWKVRSSFERLNAKSAEGNFPFIRASRDKLVNKSLRVKTTVISTTVTLLGQWLDECKKFAPNLCVKVWHPPSFKSTHPDALHIDCADLRHVDILLVSPTISLPPAASRIMFHRIIADEVHCREFENVLFFNFVLFLCLCGVSPPSKKR